MLQDNEFQRGLRDLFKYAFVTNCQLDFNDVTDLEIEAVETIDPFDVLEGFKELVLALLKFKKNAKNLNFEEFEEKIQKLELEIKNHKKNEQQLRLSVEFYKEKAEKTKENYSETLEKLKNLEKLEKSFRKTEEIHDVHHKPPRLSFSSNFKDLEHENNGFLKKNVSSLKIKEIDKNSKQNGRFLKKTLQEKSAEIARIQEKIREKIKSPLLIPSQVEQRIKGVRVLGC